MTKEKLAHQHALVKSLERDEDQVILASEKMVEQQLFLKQVRELAICHGTRYSLVL